MKIAFYNVTTTTISGGIETFNREMARALAKRGHTVHIYGGKGEIVQPVPPACECFLYPYLRRESVPNLGSRFRKFTERLSFGVFALRDLIRRDYDYIYISKPFDMPVALFAARRSRAKVIFGSGGTEFFSGYKHLVKKVDYFFACSEFNALQIEEYCGIRARVLPNGVNTERFSPLSPEPLLKEQLQIRDDDCVVISVCRLVGWKGIRYALQAVRILVKQGLGIKYLIIGEGEERRVLESLVHSLGIRENVLFLGNRDNADLPKYYALSRVAVFPSIAAETFGISIAEAMACGVPVVSTTVGGIPEVVAEGTGILVSPRDEDALAGAIASLISNEGLKRGYGERGRKRIVECFSWDRIAERFERYLAEAK